MSTQDPVEKWGARINPKGRDKHEKEVRSLNNLLLDAVDETLRHILKRGRCQGYFRLFGE